MSAESARRSEPDSRLADPMAAAAEDVERGVAICVGCLHPIAYHGPVGCDVEVRDYGDMDCGCRRHNFKGYKP